MDTQKLKDKILQLAIKGKLVEQDPNHEPASELLKKIEAEKKKLYKEGKIRKPKKLTPIKEEEKPFDIPESWEWGRLGEIINEIYGGGTPSKSNGSYWNGEINWASVKDISESDMYLETTKDFITVEGLKNSSSKIVNKNDFIISTRMGVGRIVISKIDVAINQDLKGIKLTSNFNKKLFYYFYKNLKIVGTGTTVKGIRQEELLSLYIPIMSVQEQKRIVEKIDELFKLIENLDSDKEKLLETIDITRNKVLQDAIQGKLVDQDPNDEPASELLKKIEAEKKKMYKEGKIRKPKKLPPIKEEEKPFDIPENWEWVRLGEVTIINPRNKINDNKKASFIPMNLIDEGYNNKVDYEVKLWKEIKKGYTHFSENDVVIAKITPCFENKKSAIMKNLVNSIGAGTTELHVVRIVNQTILPKYILYLAKTDKFINEGINTFTGTAGQQRISKGFIENYLITIPPLNEQKRIVEKIDRIFEYLNSLEELIKN